MPTETTAFFSSKRRTRRASWFDAWRLWARPVIFALASITFVLGLAGFTWQYAAVHGEDPDWTLPWFKTVQLFLLNSGAEDDADHPSNGLLMAARISASVFFLVVSGTVIGEVLAEVGKLPGQMLRKGHVVICGLGEVGLQLLDDLHARGRTRDVVVIELDGANPGVEYARSLGAVVFIGDATRAETLREARAGHAAELFVVTGDDGVNLEVAAEIAQLRRAAPVDADVAQLHLHVIDENLATTLEPYSSRLHGSERLRVRVFNVSRSAAIRLVGEQLWPYAPRTPDETAHYVLFGFGPMGRALAVQLVRLGQFPNRRRPRLTIVERDAGRAAAEFLSRFSRFSPWTTERPGVERFDETGDDWDVNDESLPDDVRAPYAEAVQYAARAKFVEAPATAGDERWIAGLAAELRRPGVKPVVFVCGERDRENFESAVLIHEQLAIEELGGTPIFVWLPRQPALAEALERDGRFLPFGEGRTAASYDEITCPMRETIGRKVHEAYQTLAVGRGELRQTTAWEGEQEAFRESSRCAADHLLIKLAVLGLRLRRGAAPPPHAVAIDELPAEMAALLAEMEHNRWTAERLMSGWRYVPKGRTPEEIAGNKRRRRNHNLVSWRRLDGDRDKDFELLKAVLIACQEEGFYVERAT